MSDEVRRQLGKYRGTVVDNVDPAQLGRLRVRVPDVTGAEESPWALPCAPMAGNNAGILAIPAIGAQVWVEFERGDASFPIWVGGFWSNVAPMPDVAADGILLRTVGGATISVSDDAIIISNGKGAKITLTGPVVSINEGALEVI